MDISKPFEFDGRLLTVGAITTRDGYSVRVYEDGRPVTRIFYTVAFETAIDMQTTGFTDDAVGNLMDLAKNDVVSGDVKLAARA